MASFEGLIAAIKNNSAKDVRDFLKQDPNLLKQSHDGWSALHYAAFNSNAETLDTLIVTAFSRDKDALINAARSVNNQGEIPLQLFRKNKLLQNKDSKEVKEAYTSLIYLSKPVTEEETWKEELKFDDVLKDNPDIPSDSKLYENLKIACEISNKVRSLLVFSSTHPSINLFDQEKYSSIIDSMADIIRNNELDLEYYRKHFPTLDRNTSNYLALQLIVKRIEKYSIATCLEIAQLVLNELIKKGISEVDIYQLVNGDHVFAVLGRAENSDMNDPSTWGPDAVVIDVWSMKVYPATQLQKNMEYYLDHEGVVITGPYNPAYHSVKRLNPEEFREGLDKEFLKDLIERKKKFPILSEITSLKNLNLVLDKTKEILCKMPKMHPILPGFNVKFTLFSPDYDKNTKTFIKFIDTVKEKISNKKMIPELAEMLFEKQLLEFTRKIEKSTNITVKNQWNDFLTHPENIFPKKSYSPK